MQVPLSLHNRYCGKNSNKHLLYYTPNNNTLKERDSFTVIQFSFLFRTVHKIRMLLYLSVCMYQIWENIIQIKHFFSIMFFSPQVAIFFCRFLMKKHLIKFKLCSHTITKDPRQRKDYVVLAIWSHLYSTNSLLLHFH